jgi:hypothetical protein
MLRYLASHPEGSLPGEDRLARLAADRLVAGGVAR